MSDIFRHSHVTWHVIALCRGLGRYIALQIGGMTTGLQRLCCLQSPIFSSRFFLMYERGAGKQSPCYSEFAKLEATRENIRNSPRKVLTKALPRRGGYMHQI